MPPAGSRTLPQHGRSLLFARRSEIDVADVEHRRRQPCGRH